MNVKTKNTITTTATKSCTSFFFVKIVNLYDILSQKNKGHTFRGQFKCCRSEFYFSITDFPPFFLLSFFLLHILYILSIDDFHFCFVSRSHILQWIHLCRFSLCVFLSVSTIVLLLKKKEKKNNVKKQFFFLQPFAVWCYMQRFFFAFRPSFHSHSIWIWWTRTTTTTKNERNCGVKYVTYRRVSTTQP